MFHRLIPFLLLLCPAWITTSLHGQDTPHRWTVGLDVGRSWIQGTSRDSASGESLAFRPYAPAIASVRVGRRLGGRAGGVTLGVVGSYGEAGLSLEGPDLLLADHTTRFAFYEIAPVIGVQLTGLGANGALTLSTGPVFSRWTLTDQPDRTRVGGRLELALPVWFGEHLGGAIRVAGVATPSVFEEGELPAGVRS